MIRVVAENGEAIEATVTVNPEIVAHLERLLERAKAGQVSCFAFVAWGPHHSDRGYAGIEDHSDGTYLLGMLSRVERLVQERVDTLSAPVPEFPKP